MALQRDFETLKEKNDSEKQPVCTNPLSILKAVMKQCKNMQERMLSQLAAAESRHRKVGLPIGRLHFRNLQRTGVSRHCSQALEGAGELVDIRLFSYTGVRAHRETGHCTGPDITKETLKHSFVMCHSKIPGAFFFFSFPKISVFQTLAANWCLTRLVAEQSILCLLI